MSLSEQEYQQAFYHCKRYLPGAWTKVTRDQVVISPVAGGMTNLLYRCQLTEQVELYASEPREVLLRIYGPAKGDIEVEIEIFNRLASAGLGPKLLSSFEGGRFEQYLPSNPLKHEEMIDDSVASVVAHKIASIHKLNIERLDTKSRWLVDRYRSYQVFIDDARVLPLQFNNFIPQSSRDKAKYLLEIDFETEITFLEDLFKRTQIEPLVFSHNDLHQNNVILLLDKDLNLEDRIVLIDFEYSSYNYRTFDLANHLSEWCFDYNNDDYPYFHFSLNRFPSNDKQRQFIAHYIDGLRSQSNESRKPEVNGSNSLSKEEMVEELLEEMQSCLMACNLLWTMWAIRSALTSTIVFGYWEMAESKWDCYLLTKKQFEQRSSQRRSANRRNSTD